MVDGIFDEKTKHLGKYFSTLCYKKKKGLVCCTLFDVHVPVIYPTHTNVREATMRTCVMEKSITMATLLACTAPP